MQYFVHGHRLGYTVENRTQRGAEEVLLASAIDLSHNRDWRDAGFTVEQLFPENLQQVFRAQCKTLLLRLWQSAGIEVDERFSLDQYHTKVESWSKHLRALEKTKMLPVEEFPVDIALVEERIGAICGCPLVARNPFDGQRIFHFRVVRPKSGDNNPLHRDVWLADYADCINLYIPVTGSNIDSSLILVPGSHHWPESRIHKTTEGAMIDGVKFNVPAVASIEGEYEAIRPNPSEEQVLVFSPYLIHGGAVNLNTDRTRISIELRLWKK